MTKLSLKKFMIAPVLGAVLLAACSTNPVPVNLAKNPGQVGMLKAAAPSNGFGMGGGMMGGFGSFPAPGSPKKSYGVITFERPDGFRFRSVIDGTGTSFSSLRTFSYATGFQPIEGGFFGSPDGCFPQVSSLTLGDAGTVRFTRKNGGLFARVVLRTRSGKIVPDTSKKPQAENACSKEFPKIEKAENVSEKILTWTVRVVPGKETRVGEDKTRATISLDKDFPADRVPVYPAFTSPEGESGSFGGGVIGGLGYGGVGGKTK